MNLIDAYRLMHNGALALADIEATGMAIDVNYCRRQDKGLARQIQRLQKKLEKTELGRLWREKYRNRVDLENNHQLGKILFGEMGLEPPRTTEKGNLSVDGEALEALDVPEVGTILRLRKLKKARTTYIRGLLRETVDGFLHPFFNLHLVISYRSSSDHINFQNIPVRDPEVAKIVRRAFLPRPGRQLVEIDCKAMEICVAACYHKDPEMIRYISNPAKDLHRDMACECFMIPIAQCTKEIRYCGKNMFVFPQFYGDYYGNCAKSLWDQAAKLSTKDGILLKDHLDHRGLGLYDLFEDHVKAVEDDFWHKRFKVYDEWKRTCYEHYLDTAEIRMKTGFVCSSLMGRKECMNYGTQGAAFHCLLWSLVQLNEFLRDKESCIIGQIHDSILLDVVPEELDEVLNAAHRIMTQDLLEAWKWIIVPIRVEMEVAPIDGSWYEKVEYDFQQEVPF